MSQFDTSKNKLKKIWEASEENRIKLSELENNLSDLFIKSQAQIFKNTIEIYDSGLLTLSTSSTLDSLNVVKNTKMPMAYGFVHNTNLDIPEEYIPFIKSVVEVKPYPGSDVVTNKKFIPSNYSVASDTVEIKGNGSTLFSGHPRKINSNTSRVNTLLSFFTSDELTDFQVPIGNTKKVYDGTIEWNDGIDDFKAEGIVAELGVVFDVGVGCNSNTNNDVYTGEIFAEASSESPNHKITNLTSTTFNFVGDKNELRWVDIPPCTQTSTETVDQTISSSFSATQLYTITIYGALFKKVAGNYQLQGNNQQITINSSLVTISSKTFNHIGYRAYYSSSTQGILSLFETGNADGALDEFELDNLPDTSLGHTLPYTTINFLRNQPPSPEIINYSPVITEAFQQKEILKIDENKINWAISGKVYLAFPATSEDHLFKVLFPVYNDNYTVVGTTYSLTSENHSFSSVFTFAPEPLDTQIRIRLYIQNPLYWKENRKYEF